MPNLNQSSYLREGFHFQDSFGMFLCGQWLANPSKYKSLQFEWIPDGLSRTFSLDDIILRDSENKAHLYQAKYKDDPSYKWTWDDLLEIKQGRKSGKQKSSLLQKWASSLNNVKDVGY